MCDDQVASLQQTTAQSVATGVPKMMVQRDAVMFPALKYIMVNVFRLHPRKRILQSCCLHLHGQ
jgi:hypothetical protein